MRGARFFSVPWWAARCGTSCSTGVPAISTCPQWAVTRSCSTPSRTPWEARQPPARSSARPGSRRPEERSTWRWPAGRRTRAPGLCRRSAGAPSATTSRGGIFQLTRWPSPWARPRGASWRTRTGELGDIGNRLVRALHPASFVDDATRILRAVRYAVRLGFAIEAETEAMLRRDLGYLDRIGGREGGKRAGEAPGRAEGCRDAGGGPGARRARGGLSASRGPRQPRGDVSGGRGGPGRGEGGGAPSVPRVPPAAGYRARPGGAPQAGRPERPRGGGRQGRYGTKSDGWGGKAVPRSVIHRFLRDFSEPALLGAMLAVDSPIVSERLDLFHSDLRHRRPALDGEDLKRLGVPEGPEIGRLLEMLMAAKLDGVAETREDELRLVRRARGTGGDRSSHCRGVRVAHDSSCGSLGGLRARSRTATP